MQKLAFGKKLINESTTKSAFKNQIREMILAEMNEAKKKKSEDVAPQEDVEFNIDTPTEAPMADTMAPEMSNAADINPTVKSIQDSLQKAFASAKELGDAKLVTQIGNTITMLVRDQVLGGGQQAVAEGLNENIDWEDDKIYDALVDMDHEQLVSRMLSSVENNPSITLLDFCRSFEYE
jgi:hypothetical protein